MTTTTVLFVHGGGKGAHEADAIVAGELGRALGPDFDVRVPQMPDEHDPQLAPWKKAIAAELASIGGPLVLVGHSLGGSTLLRFLCEEPLAQPVAAAYFLAAPAFDGKDWAFDELKLPDDVAERLLSVPRLAFFHCKDDEVVPFAHLALHAGKVPQAILHPIDEGGHQLEGVMERVAADVRAVT